MKRETAPRFSGIGGHHSHKAGTVEWLTPPEILAALGPFDLDPCAPIVQPYPTAARTFTARENGLLQKWTGRTWLNPPYANGVIEHWLARMAEHDNGTALIFARTETDAFFRYVWERASALLFMRGRINFIVGEPYTDEKTGKRYEIGDVAKGNAGAPTVLCAYGAADTEILAACKIDGAFVPLRFPRSVLLPFFQSEISDENGSETTWRAALAEFFAERDEPIRLADLYAAFATHPKASTNENYAAKLRQQLQVGNYRRVDRGLWERRV